MKRLKPYVAIARPDNWIKNIFLLPGTFMASYLTNQSPSDFAVRLLVGLISVCLVASANYVINEWLDSKFDRFHPKKRNRPSVVGDVKAPYVYIEYLILVFLGMGLAVLVSRGFTLFAALLLFMGLIYNVEPFRTKDVVHLDVLSESINNPIRMMMGWFIVTSNPLPPSSLIAGYWMAGAFLMAAKRLAEYRSINDKLVAGQYRRSFKFYTEESLLVAVFFYATSAAFFLGVFLVKYTIQVVLVLPFIAYMFTWYLRISLKPNSAAQHPEHLLRERAFFLYVVGVGLATVIVLIYRFPAITWFLDDPFKLAGFR